MLIEVDKKDLVSLVYGTAPYYDIFEVPLVKKCGEWIGGMADKWDWSYSELQSLSEQELYDLYLMCKKSWK